MLKCWLDVPGYKNFVSSKWRSFQVEGWGGYVLKEKLKMIKVALREWHQSHTHNIPGKISSVKERISCGMKKGRFLLWEM
jgi:NADH:ubiquinone oxidoreductase subunit